MSEQKDDEREAKERRIESLGGCCDPVRDGCPISPPPFSIGYRRQIHST